MVFDDERYDGVKHQRTKKIQEREARELIAKLEEMGYVAFEHPVDCQEHHVIIKYRIVPGVDIDRRGIKNELKK